MSSKSKTYIPLELLALVLTMPRFYVDDVEASWMNGPDFDFVHLRNMVPILKSPVRICKQAFE